MLKYIQYTQHTHRSMKESRLKTRKKLQLTKNVKSDYLKLILSMTGGASLVSLLDLNSALSRYRDNSKHCMDWCYTIPWNVWCSVTGMRKKCLFNFEKLMNSYNNGRVWVACWIKCVRIRCCNVGILCIV